MQLQNEILGWCPIQNCDCKSDCMLLANYGDKNNKCCSIAIIAASSDYILDNISELNSFLRRKEQVR